MSTINWGMIGCGSVTEKKSGPGFQKSDHSHLVAVMRRNAELAEDYANRHGVPKWYTDAHALITDPDVDAVYVATPPASHADYALDVIAQGKPVYIEKPMGLSYAECQKILGASKQTGVPVYVAYYRRALPYFLKIKELLDSDAIGQIRSVTVTQLRKPSLVDPNNPSWRLIPEISGGGLFHDLACHTLDVLDMLLGPIASAKGHSANQSGTSQADDTVTASFQFESGALGTGLWCFDSHQDYERNEIIGTKGKISFTSFTFAPIELSTPSHTEHFSIAPPEHIQQPLIQSIVNELLGTGVALSTGESAARTNKVMDMILL